MVWTGRFDMKYLIVGMSKPIFGIVQHNDTYIDYRFYLPVILNIIK